MPQGSFIPYSEVGSAIHKARAQLEAKGVFNTWSGLDDLRELADRINNGIASVSALSLDQRADLIERLIGLGAEVKNPTIFTSDRKSNQNQTRPGKVVLYNQATDEQIEMLDALAARIKWSAQDGYLLFKRKLIKCDAPLNNRQVTKLRLALTSMISQQDRSPVLKDTNVG